MKLRLERSGLKFKHNNKCELAYLFEADIDALLSNVYPHW